MRMSIDRGRLRQFNQVLRKQALCVYTNESANWQIAVRFVCLFRLRFTDGYFPFSLNNQWRKENSAVTHDTIL
jgi:hypothetical protein